MITTKIWYLHIYLSDSNYDTIYFKKGKTFPCAETFIKLYLTAETVEPRGNFQLGLVRF